MVSTKELLAQRLQQNTQQHKQAQDHGPEDRHLKQNLPLDEICLSPYQPRKVFNAKEIEELAQSIEEIGLLQPITVRRVEGEYQLIAGERRLRALRHLKRHHTEVIVLDVNDNDAALLALAENLKREDLTDFEIYLGLCSLSPELKKNKQKLAKSLGMIREDMYKYLSYEKLPQFILQHLERDPKLLSRTAATAIKKFLSDYAEQSEKAEQALKMGWSALIEGKVEQTKLATYVVKLLQPQAQSEKKHALNGYVKKIKFAGQSTGQIKMTEDELKVSLKVNTLSEQQLIELENLLVSFLEKKAE